MKHPNAALESVEVKPEAIPNMWACWDGNEYVLFPLDPSEVEPEDNQSPRMHHDHVKLSFWMHNARCAQREGKCPYFRLTKDHESPISTSKYPKKNDLCNEVHSFLADKFFQTPRGQSKQTVHPAFVSFPISECCAHIM